MSAPQPPVPPPWSSGPTPPAQPVPPAQPAPPAWSSGPIPPTQPVPPYGAPPAPPYGAPQAAPYVAPYAAPVHPQYGAALSAPAPRRSPALGIIAVIAGGIAALTPIAAAIAAFQIGIGAGKEIALRPSPDAWDITILSPVREWVLVGEVSFWLGTVLGLWALIQGIVALVSRRGRIAGIVAVVLAVVAPILFGVVTWVSLAAGLESGGSIGG